KRWLWLMLAFLAVGLIGASNGAAGQSSGTHQEWRPFSFMTDPTYNTGERIALILNVVIAFAGLAYALSLVRQVYGADTGTSRMQEIATAVREGANAYLRRQFTTVGFLIAVITGVLILTKWPWDMSADNPARPAHVQIAIGRGVAFLIGAVFSAT